MFTTGAIQHQIDGGYHVSVTPTWLKLLPGMASVEGSESEGDTPESLRVWLDRFARDFGFVGARYVHLGHRYSGRNKSDRVPVRFLTTLGEKSDPWRIGDPVTNSILGSFVPFIWSARDNLELTDLERSWLSVERIRGVRAGITIPVQDYLAGPAYISLLGESDEVLEATLQAHVSTLISLGIFFHCRAKATLRPAGGPKGALSERELSCLRHAATGANVAMTAAALKLASRTVELYISDAAAKLHAENKVNAVAIAISAGLIQL